MRRGSHRGRWLCAAAGILTFTGLAAALHLGGFPKSSSPPTGLAVGDHIPSFVVPGQRETLGASTLQGHTLVIAFARPDRGSETTLRRVAALAPPLIGPNGAHLLFLAISGPGGGQARGLERFGERLGITAGLLYAGDPGGAVAREFGVRSQGTVFVVRPNGRVAWTGVNPTATALRHALHASDA